MKNIAKTKTASKGSIKKNKRSKVNQVSQSDKRFDEPLWGDSEWSWDKKPGGSGGKFGSWDKKPGAAAAQFM